MDVFSTELGIWFSFVKTSEFREGREVDPPPTQYATAFLGHSASLVCSKSSSRIFIFTTSLLLPYHLMIKCFHFIPLKNSLRLLGTQDYDLPDYDTW
jgi:hypothetical protein